MRKAIVKYLIISVLLAVYINRGFFIAPYEVRNYGGEEVNSVVEWVMQLVTGESNGIDEDSELQSDYNWAKVASSLFCQYAAQHLDLLNLYPKYINKNMFPDKENLYLKDFIAPVDRPPQWS